MPESLPERLPESELGSPESPVLPASKPVWQAWGESPPGVRELVAVGLLVLLCDVTIYRGHGYAGYALLFACVPLLLGLGAWQPSYRLATWVTGGFLALVSLRLLWNGAWLTAMVGFVFVLAFAMALRGSLPYVPEMARFATRLFSSPYRRIACYLSEMRRSGSVNDKPSRSMEYVLPLAALLAFGAIFVFANPSLVEYVFDGFQRMARELQRWLANFSILEVVFWATVAWLGFGLVRPRLDRLIPFREAEPLALEVRESSLYRPFRNTLLSVVVLFTVYLVFELTTLWFREFPEGFYYAGYAHQGAAWLTIALALATLTLSLIFREETLRDPRHKLLRRLAWVWSLQNFVLALSVFNRMHIYIDFNGMTRMRMIGLFGITTVVVGFVLVLVKILRGKSFRWLLRTQLWALGLAISIYALMPVDILVHRYNVSRVMQGDLPAAVQLSVHPIDDEGYLVLWPLLDCPNVKIRRGIQGMLAEKQLAIGKPGDQTTTDRLGWTAYQMSEQRLRQQLRERQSELAPLINDETARRQAIEQFDEYVYQWY